MEYTELALIEKTGNLLAYAVFKKRYNRYELIEKWLASETYEATINFEVHLCSQSKTYILATFEKEYKNDLPSIDERSPLYEDDIFWFGYVMAYWFFTDGTTGKDILATTDISKVLNEYDILHTISVKHAIEKIKEDDSL